MPTRKPSSTADDELAAAIQAAAAAGERFVEAKSELEHRLADIDTALLELIQRVYDSTPSEYQRTFRVSENGAADDDLPLPEFVRFLLERPRGTRASFSIEVIENLYDTSGDDDSDSGDEEEDDDLGF